MEKSKPVSPSEFWVYYNKPEEYYMKYILGLDMFEPNEAMELGTVIHLGFEGKNWSEELEKRELSEYSEVVSAIFDNDLPDIPEHEVWLGEYGRVYEQTGSRLSGRADGVDKEKDIVYEVKTSKYHWNDYRLNMNNALTHYSFLYFSEHGVIPECHVISCSTRDGTVKVLKTRKTTYQINAYLRVVEGMVDELKLSGWWKERISTYNK